MPIKDAHTRSLVFDAVLALGAALLGWSIAVPMSDQLDPGPRGLVLGLVGVHAAAIALRRARPWIALSVNLASGLTLVALGMPLVTLTLAPLIVLYSVASLVPGRRSLGALAAAVASFLVAEAMAGFTDDLSTVIADVVALGAAWLIGWFVYGRQEYVRRLEAKTAELQAAREELARVAVMEERLRIARELHDIVAHSLSVIAVQAGVGAHVGDASPAEAKAALVNVERASRDALNEMRALLGTLRNENGEREMAPLPGLAQLPSLIEKVSDAGPEIDLRVHGEPWPLPAGPDLTAYRVVQESLTNVVRHAQAERVRVALTYGMGSLVIEVIDDGTATGEPEEGGHGIEGMRERVQGFGGTFEAGPMREGGFRVRAELPVKEPVG